MPLANALRGAEISGDLEKPTRENLMCRSVLNVSIIAALASAASAHSVHRKFETTIGRATSNGQRFV